MNILYVQKHLNGGLPVDTLETLKFEKANHSYGTRSITIGLLKRANVNTSNYGLASFSHLSSNQWNEFQKCFPNLNLTELLSSRLESLSTNYYLSSYQRRILILRMR